MISGVIFLATLKDQLLELYEENRDKNYKIGRTAFAQKCGITRGQLDGYLRGSGEKLWDTLRTIVKNNQVTVSWLLGETELRYNSAEKIKTLFDGLSPEDVYKVKEFIAFIHYQKKIAKKNKPL